MPRDMKTRCHLIASLLLATCVLPACKSKSAENQPARGSAVAAGSAAPAPMANPAEGSATGSAAAPAGSAAAGGPVDPLSVPAVPVPPGKETGKGPGQTITASFEDPATSPHKSVSVCPGDKLAIVVPARDSSWTVVKTDPALGKPVEDVVKGWLGPNTNGAKFTWSVKVTNEYTIVLEEQKTHEKVALELAVFGCD
jgi:hypothetical protein